MKKLTSAAGRRQGPGRETGWQRRGIRAMVLAGLLALGAGGCVQAPVSGQVFDSQEHRFRTVNVVEGLEYPWSLAFLPNGDWLVTERPGRLRLVRNGRLAATPISGVPDVYARGQGGLMDVVVHPDFAANQWVYLSFSKPGRQATTAVIRARLDGMALTEVTEIFEADATSGRAVHFGSRMRFAPDGTLFITIGERGEQQHAQNRRNHQGTVVRLNDDGSVPDDNPFVGVAGARPEIYSYGHRSPQGLVLHPETGEFWETEHGPRGGDEVNILRPGANYGWPVITYGINYNGTKITDETSRPGMEQPIHYWVPSIATSGATIYTGDRFPEWRGDLFVGALALQHLARLTFDGHRLVNEEQLLVGLRARIRDVRNGPDGYLYVLVDSDDAPILRLEPVR